MGPASRARTGFLLVFRREFRWLFRRPVLLMLTTVFPLGLMALLTAVFSAGLPTQLSIGVLDRDGSDTSRGVIRMVAAAPEVRIVDQVADLGEGRRAIVSGRLSGLVMLPQNFERDMRAGRRPEVVFFYDNQHMTAGGLIQRGVANAVATAAAGARVSLRSAQGQPIDAAQGAINPIPVRQSPLFNPALDYVHFLLAALLPAILQIFVATTAVYSVGLDLERRNRLMILERLGGSLLPAMLGKLLPYTLIFMMLLGLSDSVLFGVFGLPLRGNPGLLVLAGVLFILACQFLGALALLLIRDMGRAISLIALVVVPAFGFMGIGFPIIGMNAFASAWSALIPGRWYLQARIDQTVRGTPPDLSWEPVLILALFAGLLACLCALRLEAMRRQVVARRTDGTSTAVAT